MKKVFGFLITALLVFTACKDHSTGKESLNDSLENKKQEQQVTSSVTITNTSWPGTYAATLPCADCPGIKTELTLMADNTYELKEEYLERKVDAIKNQGNFTWMPDSAGIELQGIKNGGYKFLMQNKQLVMLGADGKAVEGKMAELFILKKIQ